MSNYQYEKDYFLNFQFCNSFPKLILQDSGKGYNDLRKSGYCRTAKFYINLESLKFNLYFNFVCNSPFVVGQIFLCFCFYPLSPIFLLLSVYSVVLVYPVLIVFAILSPSVPSFSLFLCVSLNCLICSNFTSLSIPFFI